MPHTHTQVNNTQTYKRVHKIWKFLCMSSEVKMEDDYFETGPAGHLTASISPARVDSSMSRKTLTRVAQVTGCLPLPVTHSWRISVLIRSGSFKFLWAMFLTLDPVLSSRRKVPNRTYLVAISTGMLVTLWSAHVNLSSSGRVGLVPGLHVEWG